MNEDPRKRHIAFEHKGQEEIVQNDGVEEAKQFDKLTRTQTVFRVEDDELENMFIQILQDLENCNNLEMHPRERLPKLKLTSNIEETANRILDEYLHGDENIHYR